MCPESLSKFVDVLLGLVPDQSTPLGSLGLGWQGWHRTTMAVATLTVVCVLQVTSQRHLGPRDSSGAIAGMLDLQSLNAVLLLHLLMICLQFPHLTNGDITF